MSKHAEWVDLNCGLCRMKVDVGTIDEWDIDPNCRDHETITCAECGEQTHRATVSHGSLGTGFHRVVEQT